MFDNNNNKPRISGNIVAVPLSAIQTDSKTDSKKDNAAKTSSTTTSSACIKPVSLTALDRDCFVIPVQSIKRFLPAGMNPLGVFEVPDTKIRLLVHLMSPLQPLNPALESPLSHPLIKQKTVAAELLHEIQQTNIALNGMLLTSMEKNSDFPFIAYYVVNTAKTDPLNFYSGIQGASLSKFKPENIRYTGAHTLNLYSEVVSICRPPLEFSHYEINSFKKSQTPTTGYIISVYKVFEGDDGEIFEKNWMYWTGARMLYR